MSRFTIPKLFGFASIFLLALILPSNAHTYLDSIWLNGANLPSGDCLRPHPSISPENPISLVSSSDMTCGFLPYSAQPANRKCPVAAGSSMSLQWWHTQPGDDVIASTHKGPCMIYLAQSDSGAGNVWFKIFESGLDIPTQTWCVDTLLANRGRLDFTIPANIAPGNYLLRGEIIALHNGGTLDGSQPYVGCVELTITGSGTVSPPASSLVAFPGAYKNTDPGLYPVSLYNGPLSSYVIPGPAIWGGSTTNPTKVDTNQPSAPSGGSSQPASSSSTGSSSTPSNPTPPPSGSTSVIPTATSTSSCAAVKVSAALRAGASWGSPINNIFDITVTNSGSGTVSDLVVSITVQAPATSISEVWNLQKTSTAAGTNTYWFVEHIDAGHTYTGAGFIVVGGNANVQVVCGSSGSSATTGTPAPAPASTSTTTSSSQPSTPSTSSSSSNNSPSGSMTSSCGTVTVAGAKRNVVEPTGHNLYDLTVVNTGATISANTLHITIVPTGSNAVLQSSWNLASSAGANTFAFSETINGWSTYTGAGFVIQGSDASASANVQIVCSYSSPSSSSTTSSSPTYSATSTTGIPAPPPPAQSSSTSTTTSTTGSSAPSNPTPPATSSSSSSSSGSCQATATSTITQSWFGGGLVSIVVTNTGSQPIRNILIDAGVGASYSPWNLVSSSGTQWGLPSWGLPMAPGAKFDAAGYSFSGPQPPTATVVSVSC